LRAAGKPVGEGGSRGYGHGIAGIQPGACFGYSLHMDIPAGLLPGHILWLADALALLLLTRAVWTAPWSKIRDSEALHVFLGACVGVIVLWLLHGGIQRGLDVHLLGVTSLCLLFDWQFALFAVTLVLAATTWQGTAGWESLGVNIITTGVVPVFTTRVLLLLCQWKLPHNFFIYIFINAFLAGALSILFSGLSSAGIQELAGVRSHAELINNFLAIFPMLMFGEGFLNGAAMSLAVAYRPAWVATFHDRWYLQGK
jgi:uncharacterized membrane protein